MSITDYTLEGQLYSHALESAHELCNHFDGVEKPIQKSVQLSDFLMTYSPKDGVRPSTECMSIYFGLRIAFEKKTESRERYVSLPQIRDAMHTFASELRNAHTFDQTQLIQIIGTLSAITDSFYPKYKV